MAPRKRSGTRKSKSKGRGRTRGRGRGRSKGTVRRRRRRSASRSKSGRRRSIKVSGGSSKPYETLKKTDQTLKKPDINPQLRGKNYGNDGGMYRL